MSIKDIIVKMMTPKKENQKDLLYVVPLILICSWILLSLVSLFLISGKVLTSPFVIASIISRVVLPVPAIFFIKKYYLEKEMSVLSYKHYLNYFGYSITLTYVFHMLPTVVTDFYHYESSSLASVLLVIFTTSISTALYLVLRSASGKLVSGFYTEKEVQTEKECKKNKVLKKKEHKKFRKQRTFIQNVWFELFDPFFWAIIWVLLLHNFLFQLYEIPSSSMVPTFLIKDRVVASKFLSGPRIPLTNYYLPDVAKPKTGDIVTFNNPKVEDPESDLHYKNVFTRICQPFVFMLTLSKVDIDKKANGEAKERQLVKRVIGSPGEKVCMVNDKVYKKVAGGEWTLMSDIPGEKEWGHSDLFSINNPNSGDQIINPYLRKELDEAANSALEYDKEELERDLTSEKRILQENLGKIDIEKNVKKIETYIKNKSNEINDIYNNYNYSHYRMAILNNEKKLKEELNLYKVTNADKKKFIEEYRESLDKYKEVVLFAKMYDLKNLIQLETNIIDSELKTDVEINNNQSPYEVFENKLTAVIKLESLKLFNKILEHEDISTLHDLKEDPEFDLILHKNKILSMYTKGFGFSTFGSGNLPEYPAGADNYIPEGEYFVLGDNRYNSKDSRMGDFNRTVTLSGSDSIFSTQVSVQWDPYTINEKYIHGKVRFIAFPFSRFKIFN